MNEHLSSAVPPQQMSDVLCITVTFNPDIAVLAQQLAALPADSLKTIVDNASEPNILQALLLLVSGRQDIHLVCNTENLGLAAALNIGVRAAQALSPQSRFALLLDQDSEPLAGSIEALLSGFLSLESQGIRIGCAGPKLLDAHTGLQHGFHQQLGWRWHREFPMLLDAAPIPCANLNGSGTLLPVVLFTALGGLDEGFFIDHVDTEWSFRVLAAGYGLWGIPQATFIHRMGQDSVRFWWFGWRVWPSRSPRRHYYLFRNAVLLMRRPYVPWVWKLWAVVKLALTALVHTAAPQWRAMARGISDGWRS